MTSHLHGSTRISLFPQEKTANPLGILLRTMAKLEKKLPGFSLGHGRALINKKTQVKAPAANLTEIVKQFNQRADDRRATAALPPPPPRAVELLPKNADFMPQGITERVKSCAKQWCRANRIPMT